MKMLFLLGFLGLTATGRGTAQDLYDEGKLRTIELNFDQPEYWDQLLMNKGPELYIPADLTVDGVVYEDVGVRFKGHSSYFNIGSSPRKSFNIDLNEFVSGQNVQGYRKLILNNGYADPSFVREVVAYHVFRGYVAAPKANHVKLLINGESWGVYVNVQHLGEDMLAEWFGGPSGNRYKSVGLSDEAALTWLGNDPAAYDGPYEFKSESNPDPWTDLIALCNTLNNTAPGSVIGALQPLLSVDGALRMIALNNVFGNLDSYYAGHSFYVFHDQRHDRMHTLVWDLNMSFGTSPFATPLSYAENLSPYFMFKDPDRPLVSRLLPEVVGGQDYQAHLRGLLTDFDWAVIGPLAQARQDLIRAEVYLDPKKLYSNQHFDENLTQPVLTGGPGPNTVPGLTTFVNARRASLLARPELTAPAPIIGPTVHTPAVPMPNEAIGITTTLGTNVALDVVEVYWRITGPYVALELFDDGLHGDGAAADGVFGNTLGMHAEGSAIDYYVRARATAGSTVTFDPPTAEHAPFHVAVPSSVEDLYLNEFLASNQRVLADEAGEFDDWIELHNAAPAMVDVGGLFLTDDPGSLTRWPIPTGTRIGPRRDASDLGR